ncbi:MAG: type II toxin-antitoxin system PemK/MazF family toxin [Gammaproteobacteria bacterium]|nr:type II toxin-antitoxin system PemK/MazF family toxin [Gammaproteobacteria bacterium]MBL4729700.1 type II toxin-antitoxin system PemK/MazF family toxin [Gammaproteobacteria bacterium]
MYVPEQGDIVFLDFDPSAGKEITKRRPALVLSKRIFNDTTGFVVVAAITNTSIRFKMQQALPTGLKTTGSVVIPQMKSIDFVARNVEFVEKLDADSLKTIGEMARLILS